MRQKRLLSVGTDRGGYTNQCTNKDDLSLPCFPQRPTKFREVPPRPTADAGKRTRGGALEATVSTKSIPGLVLVNSMYVQADGTRVITTGTTLLQLPPSGMLAKMNRGRAGVKGIRAVCGVNKSVQPV